ncbi:MAG: glycoside hydrolase family 3 C-terminal domain-containing protein [Caldilineaceae bacterium]|nr:glycoside hydrolase family 3 C-terminal domain-containing protein [Caldilineaceae bacterium]MBP8108080.1 glycoside hydrolase family 3 C-terminal domain-containing protein [Caldilineaceae bacterium]MBP8124352.1 glycoside hydrolase family 3 C-terminal domain-containing protein [Caldilineaceae bacterium]MBP9074299.1 glycoside hydrolase family 3 C-terminal domain-containing protein [Caldilineaceae bacterium]
MSTLSVSSGSLNAPAPADFLPYQDPSLPVAERVADLLSRMTLAEKLAQLGSRWMYELFGDTQRAELLAQGIGQITRIGGASNYTPTESAAMANEIQRMLRDETRLGIPAMVHEECCAGYMARAATVFPQIIGLASTWQPELAGEMAGVVRTQMRAVGAHQGLSPVLDVVRDPRWGRVEETFGEDATLTANMGAAYVRGIQTQDWRQGVIATGKHFVGYGLTDGGFNWNPAHIPARELREVFLAPFEAAVKEAGLYSIMNGYNEIDGVPCAASRSLLTDILRDEWGFDGIVVSDYFAVDMLQKTHHVAGDKGMSAHMALYAGIDVELPSTDCYGEPLAAAVAAGLVDEALVDVSVARVLRTKFQLGLFEQPMVEVDAAAPQFDTPSQRQLARRIAQKSLVLLKNRDNLLPLAKSLKSVAVIGPNADSARNLVGDYTYICHIETLIEMREKENPFGTAVASDVELVQDFVPINPILAAIGEKLGPDAAIHFAQGCDINSQRRDGIAAAVEAARQAEIAIVVVGDKSGLTDDCTSGEARDRADLGLPGVQQELVEAVVATGTPTIVVLVNGRPLSISWIAEHVPAIVEAWLPGEEGAEAVADVLFGDINPGGKLPMTFPRSVGQVPVYYGVKPSGGRSHWKTTYVDLSNTPLFPFGFGLSYTTFGLENLRLDRSTAGAGESVTAWVEVVNTGQRAGDQVVQLYVRDEVASITRPLLALAGFQRLSLQPGERRTVRFDLPVNQLAFLDGSMRWVVEPGTIKLFAGTSAADLPLAASFEITGATQEVERAFFTLATVE